MLHLLYHIQGVGLYTSVILCELIVEYNTRDHLWIKILVRIGSPSWKSLKNSLKICQIIVLFVVDAFNSTMDIVFVYDGIVVHFGQILSISRRNSDQLTRNFDRRCGIYAISYMVCVQPTFYVFQLFTLDTADILAGKTPHAIES